MTATVSDFAFYSTRNAAIVNGRTQRALLIGRQTLIQRNTVYSGGFPIPTTIRPTAIPWTLLTDRWGVAFPGGILGVTDWVAQLSPATHSYPVEWTEFWEESVRNGLGHVVAVPAALPVGYTPRLKRDWRSSEPFNAILEQYSGGPGYPIRDSSGFTRYNWTPDTRVWGMSGQQVTSSGPSPSVGSKYFGVYDTGIGYRKVQIQIQYLDLGGAPWTGSADVILSHNAAGPSGSSTTDGDTTDFTASYSYASFSGGGIGTTYSTAWIDVGAVSPTLGTITGFKASMDLTSIAGMFTFGVVLSFRLSPRVDVPLPYSCTSRGDRIAPGGVAP